MKFIATVLIIVSFVSCKQDASIQPRLSIDVSKDLVIPKHYVVPKAEAHIEIDGLPNDNSWNHTAYTDYFIDIEGIKKPKFDTRLKMLWDSTNLYVYVEMEEPHVWGYLEQRDTIIFYNNDFEVFIDPSGVANNYGEIEINALNTVWDLFLDKPYRVGGKANFEWNLNDLRTAVKVYGTVNEPKDIDSLWSVEMAIPLKPFVSMKDNPKSYPKDGEQWRINFSRVEWDHDIRNGKYYRKKSDDGFLREYNWVWSNQKVINMHEPEKWGYLQFSEQYTSEGVEFLEDNDLTVKQIAYALFRETSRGQLKALLDNDSGQRQEIEVTYKEGKTTTARFIKTNFGFEYVLRSLDGDTEYIINQEGKLKTR